MILTIDSRGHKRSADILSNALHCEIGLFEPTNPHVILERDFIAFMEIIPSGWKARCAVLVPNHERMSRGTIENLHRCDEIWCKTRYAEKLFSEKGCTRYIGFTSKDAYLDVTKDYGKFLHVAGTSTQKGTAQLMDLWRKHPEWPLLRVVVSRDFDRPASNIALYNEMSESALHTMMNECGIHLCPSSAEGFGHTITEALSTKAVVITTDGPPMNESVRPEFGLLVEASPSPMGFGERFRVNPDDLERKIMMVMMMPNEQKRIMGELARNAFLERDKEFRGLIWQ